MNAEEHEALETFEAPETFKDTISSLIGEHTKAAERNTPPPPTIYHYTNVKGALGILKSGELWFTERTHLNDPVEIQYGLRIAQELFEKAAQDTSAHIPNDATSHLKEAHTSGLARFGFWIFSASLNGNDIGQWRSYADDGRGVCLGFSLAKFDMKQLAKDNIPYALNSRKFPVDYCEHRLTVSMARYIDSGLETLATLNKNISNGGVGAWHTEQYFWLLLNDGIYVNSTLYKHRAYAREEEYRLLIIAERDRIAQSCTCHDVRERNGEIVGYLKIPIPLWNKFPSWRAPGILAHIRVGPAAPDQLVDQIRTALNRFRIPLAQVVIDKSDLPYRSTR